MAGNALGMVLVFLLIASITQGSQDVEVVHYEKIEGVVGQNITLPCILKSATDYKIVSIEWTKKKNNSTKLALYHPQHGTVLFWPNVTIQSEKNEAGKVVGSYLQLSRVEKWDSGTYMCDNSVFPSGSLKKETELIIRDDFKIKCNVNGTIKVHEGENVTIRCTAFSNAQYMWTKNETLLSETESLELRWVTDTDAGVYTVTVNTGSTSLQETFVVTVLTANTSSRTVSPQVLTDSTGTSLPPSQMTEFPTFTNWTTTLGTNNPNTSNATIRLTGHTSSFTNSTHINTSFPGTYSDDSHLLHSTSLSYGPIVLTTKEMATDEMKNESKLPTQQPDDTATVESTSDITAATTIEPTELETVVIKDQDASNNLFLPLILVPMLVLIVVAGFICRRNMMKKRMDPPPPFKPPPPPVKYTAARQSETATQFFPISRCNSAVIMV
ncbi:uncharacterized protein KZ484_018663 [Pholidichthys leucotaenia]